MHEVGINAHREIFVREYIGEISLVFWQSGADFQVAKVQVIQEEIGYFYANATVRQKISEASNTAEAVKAVYENGLWQVIDNGLILG